MHNVLRSRRQQRLPVHFRKRHRDEHLRQIGRNSQRRVDMAGRRDDDKRNVQDTLSLILIAAS